MTAAERGAAVAEAMADIRCLDDAGVDRKCVEGIRDRLLHLAAQRDLFPVSDFPPPADGGKSCMYRVAQDDDDRFALYVQVVADRTEAPPHDHTTWAVIVGFQGQELNKQYGGAAGGGAPEVVSEFMVEEGKGIGFLPDELHSIHIEGGSMNFHCYGRALEALDSRRYWDSKAGDWKVFPPMSAIIEARV
jgi:predicted metal-dependent enzyme (double-stranded beta helix superfamily)